MQGTLSIVGTPIGNLEDITLRALRTLRECDFILSEDTRITQILLKKYDIQKPLFKADSHMSVSQLAKIKTLLEEGKKLCLVSDAGMPGISDPGMFVIDYVRKSKVDCVIDVIPGPTAVTAAVSLAAIPGNEWIFIGFVPQKKGRLTALKEMNARECATVMYESSHRIMKLLLECDTHLPTRVIGIGRELTKMYEEFLQGSPSVLRALLLSNPQKQKGEFVVIVYPLGYNRVHE